MSANCTGKKTTLLNLIYVFGELIQRILQRTILQTLEGQDGERIVILILVTLWLSERMKGIFFRIFWYFEDLKEPFFCRWTIVGITSWGWDHKMCSHYPGVATRVAKVIDWIKRSAPGAQDSTCSNKIAPQKPTGNGILPHWFFDL